MTPKLAVTATPLPVQSTAAPAEYANQKFSYALTTTTDPAQPGKAAQFTLTVTNLTSSREYLRLIFHVPRFTRYRGSVEGVSVELAPGWVSGGASVSTYIDLTVIGGNQSPPDGSVIALALVDPDRGASFSRSVTVKAAAGSQAFRNLFDLDSKAPSLQAKHLAILWPFTIPVLRL